MALSEDGYVRLGYRGVFYRRSVAEVLIHLPDIDLDELNPEVWQDDLCFAYKILRTIRIIYPDMPIQQIRVQGLADF
jgi:hypothetical protein